MIRRWCRHLGLLVLLGLLFSGLGYGQLGQPGKDIVPVSLVFDPPSPVRQGDRVKVTVTIENQGTQTVGYTEEEEIPIEFYYRPITARKKILFGTRTKPGLDPGETGTVFVTLDTLQPISGAEALKPGRYRIYAQIGDIPGEYKENNEISIELRIEESEIKPDLYLSSLIFDLLDPEGLVELAANPILAAGERRLLLITPTIINIGTDDTAATVRFSRRLRGESELKTVEEKQNNNLLRREEWRPFLNLNLGDTDEWPPGVYVIRVEADPDDLLDELNEANNLLTRSLFIVDTARMRWSYPPLPVPLTRDEEESRLRPLEGGPVVGEHTVYFGADDGKFYALREDGSLKWSYSAGGAIRATPAQATDVTGKTVLLFGADDGHLYALDEEGKLLWKFPQEGSLGPIRATPAVSGDTVYFGTDTGTLYAVGLSDGNLRWSFTTGMFIRTTPAVAIVSEDGAVRKMVYFGSGDGYLYALEDRGDHAREHWAFPTGSFIKSSPQIYGQTIYFGSSDGHLYALFLDGTKRWQYPEPGELPLGAIETPPLVTTQDGDIVIYFGTNEGVLHKLVDRGDEADERWRFDRYRNRRLGALRFAPALQGEMLYLGSDDGTVYALRDRGASVADEWAFPTRGAIGGSPALSGGTLYVASWEGHLYALRIE